MKISWIASVVMVSFATTCDAADYFLTIAGGYSREGNQASLEANVRFLQEVLLDQYDTPPSHTIYFADGFDDGADLQVAVDRTAMTAQRFLAGLHASSRSRGGSSVTYRNHHVSGIAGSTKPDNIRSGLQDIAQRLVNGDRLIVYVTAHGSAAKSRNKFNTTIDCWDRSSISCRDLSRWLDDVPTNVPVIMVMAQCFCGGFAHAVFDGADSSRGLSDHLRTGFFAQQHNLAAAGCRPDIDNDQEYSSFFWGALVGRTRNGRPLENVDLNRDGIVSFAEAHAYAVLESDTIDIPLRASESLLRELGGLNQAGSESRSSTTLSEEVIDLLRGTSLTTQELIAGARPDVRELVIGLINRLNISLDDRVESVVDLWAQQRDKFRSARRTSYRERRRNEAKEALQEEIFFVWPDLADSKTWRQSELLNEANRDGLMADIKLLPSYVAYEESLQQRKQASDASAKEELSHIKMRRLIETFVSVVLADRLADVADKTAVIRYQQMVEVEESGFSAGR